MSRAMEVLKLLGPPTPLWMTYLVRFLQVSSFIVIIIWAFFPLGGLKLSPVELADGSGANDTSQLFNWHPILMSFAFIVCMGEAVLAYKAPLIRYPDRKATKYAHFGLHTIAGTAMVLGFVAVYKAHTLKRPTPMSDFYSVHSWMGVSTFFLFACQWTLGLLAFLVPRWSAVARSTFAPIHGFIGLATLVFGLSTIIAGLQEKATFVQLVSSPGVRSASMQLPVAAAVFIVFFALFLLYHFVPTTTTRGSGPHVGQEILEQRDNVPLYTFQSSTNSTAMQS